MLTLNAWPRSGSAPSKQCMLRQAQRCSHMCSSARGEIRGPKKVIQLAPKSLICLSARSILPLVQYSGLQTVPRDTRRVAHRSPGRAPLHKQCEHSLQQVRCTGVVLLPYVPCAPLSRAPGNNLGCSLAVKRGLQEHRNSRAGHCRGETPVCKINA